MSTPTKLTRPKVVNSVSEIVDTGCGPLKVTVGFTEDNKPLEVIVGELSKNGYCTSAFQEGLTRSITLGVKYGVPIAEFVKDLEGIRCQSSVMFPKEKRVLSCPDAIANILRKYI